jgi:hypothetical protein
MSERTMKIWLVVLVALNFFSVGLCMEAVVKGNGFGIILAILNGGLGVINAIKLIEHEV